MIFNIISNYWLCFIILVMIISMWVLVILEIVKWKEDWRIRVYFMGELRLEKLFIVMELRKKNEFSLEERSGFWEMMKKKSKSEEEKWDF